MGTVCGVCPDKGTDKKASTYCTDCQQRFCSCCARIHSSQKASKQHKLIDIAERQMLLDSSIEELCKSCLNMGESNLARMYCTMCDENLCVECSALHGNSKMTKSHLRITIEEFKKTQQSSKVVCMQCNENGSEMHASLKATKSHTLSDIPLKISDLRCYPCKVSDSEVNAVHHCAGREEFHCSTYGEVQGRKKATLSHNVVDVTKIGKPKNERDYKGGGIGLGELKSEPEFDEIVPDVLKSPIGELGSDEHESEFGDMDLDEQKSEFMYPPKRSRLEQDMDMDKRPGAPRPDEVQSDSIELFWDHPEIISPEKPVKEYEIRYRELPNSEWRRYSEFPDRACVRIKGLKSKSSYTFKVRAVYDDFEGPYSPESIEITTKATLASELFPFTVNAKEGEEGTPSIQCLLKTEIENSRNEKARTKKIEIGKPPAIAAATEKTILLVGETGSGKSTLVDGFINYIAGVNYEDHFRLTLVDLEEEEKGKSQATSQTEWVTCYTIHPSPGSRIPYTLNIIDTPGFGDTRGLDRDKEIFEQLRQLFSAKGEKGVVFIDAACFVLKAPDARLTPNQMYIFTSVLSLFGKDIKENMCALITFADSKKPQVLSAMKEAKLPVEVWYLFNNSGLFANNDSTSHAQIYWEMVSESFQKFFKGLENMTTKSLQQTKEVLENRKKMETTISNLQPLIDAGLKKQEEVRKEMLISESHESDIAAKRNFEYTVEETHMRKSDLQNGQFATNCPNCKVTCHHNCTGTSNALNYLCSAMDWFGNCTVCVGKCGFLEHKNEQSIYRFVTENVTKTYADRLKEYEAAKKKKLTHEQYIEEMKKDLSVLETTVSSMMAEVHQCKTILSEIALQPNVISLKEHIDLMIQSEERGKNEGYKERIAILKSHQERYDLGKKIDNQKTNDLKGKHGEKKGFFAKLFS